MNSKNAVWISPLLLPKSPLDPRNNEYSTSVMVAGTKSNDDRHWDFPIKKTSYPFGFHI